MGYAERQHDKKRIDALEKLRATWEDNKRQLLREVELAKRDSDHNKMMAEHLANKCDEKDNTITKLEARIVELERIQQKLNLPKFRAIA